MTAGSRKSGKTPTESDTAQTGGRGTSPKSQAIEALAELVAQLEGSRAESAELERLMQWADLDPIAALKTAGNLRSVAEILKMADRILTLERIKLDGLALLALHQSEPGGSG